MKTIAIVAAVLPLLATPAGAGDPANKAGDKPEVSQRKGGMITEESRKATLAVIMHHGVFQQRPTRPGPMHCRISSKTGRWQNCF
jgi:hypothetical protein